ncbi:hypothetical protein [Actinomadura parmotrematis]|uniref:Ig-like domain-containing protein n=1 Tax=Actinomadura parmotrematis TaxID=2864039 RepID=A0ABS7G0M9_9ACTN|nr:hypothetical protein [Actinomadura parmotrematis]MBW8485424.1 hypothetical protein [Actinomadura parmotrematis]
MLHPHQAARIRARGRAVTASLLLAGGLLPLIAAPPASARLADVTCPAGNQTVSFSPGVKTAPQTVTVTYNAALGVCASLSQPSITSGTSGGTVTVTLSCADLLSTTTGTQVFTWNTGQSSTLAFTRTVTNVNGQTVITLRGKISAGLFTGRTAVFTVVEPVLDLTACQTAAGLTSQAGVTTLLIT